MKNSGQPDIVANDDVHSAVKKEKYLCSHEITFAANEKPSDVKTTPVIYLLSVAEDQVQHKIGGEYFNAVLDYLANECPDATVLVMRTLKRHNEFAEAAEQEGLSHLELSSEKAVAITENAIREENELIARVNNIIQERYSDSSIKVIGWETLRNSDRLTPAKNRLQVLLSSDDVTPDALYIRSCKTTSTTIYAERRNKEQTVPSSMLAKLHHTGDYLDEEGAGLYGGILPDNAILLHVGALTHFLKAAQLYQRYLDGSIATAADAVKQYNDANGSGFAKWLDVKCKRKEAVNSNNANAANTHTASRSKGKEKNQSPIHSRTPSPRSPSPTSDDSDSNEFEQELEHVALGLGLKMLQSTLNKLKLKQRNGRSHSNGTLVGNNPNSQFTLSRTGSGGQKPNSRSHSSSSSSSSSSSEEGLAVSNGTIVSVSSADPLPRNNSV